MLRVVSEGGTYLPRRMKKAHEFNTEALAADLLSFVRSRILADNVRFSVDTSFQSVGIESVSLLEILLYLEREFDIYVADESLTAENISSVRQLALTAYATVSGS
jgi:acyl carrier protein